MHRVPLLCSAALAAFATSALGAGQAIIVGPNPGPGTDFFVLQQAVDAAGDGDLVLVRPGSYGNVLVNNKSLTLHADPGPGDDEVRVQQIVVQNLTAAKAVTVRGFAVGPLGLGPRLNVMNCQGGVVVEDCLVEASGTATPNQSVILVSTSQHVALVRCRATGPNAALSTLVAPPPGAAALGLADSNVFVQGGTYRGGVGSHAQAFFPGVISVSSPGGKGIDVANSLLHAVAATIEGGPGGNATQTTSQCFAASNGGAGIGGTGSVILLDSDVAGGPAGENTGACVPASDGLATQLTAGSVATIPDLAREFEVTSPAVEGQLATTTVRGVPGEAAFMLRGFAADPTYVSSLKGGLVPAFPLQIIALGVVPPSGEITFSVLIPLGVLPPAIDFVDLHHQVLVAGATGTGLLGTSSVATVVRP